MQALTLTLTLTLTFHCVVQKRVELNQNIPNDATKQLTDFPMLDKGIKNPRHGRWMIQCCLTKIPLERK